MGRLEEIRIELANEYGCKDMVELELLNIQMEHTTDFEKIIAQRYAKECVIASLYKASETVKCDYSDIDIIQNTIESQENIILL